MAYALVALTLLVVILALLAVTGFRAAREAHAAEQGEPLPHHPFRLAVAERDPAGWSGPIRPVVDLTPRLAPAPALRPRWLGERAELVALLLTAAALTALALGAAAT